MPHDEPRLSSAVEEAVRERVLGAATRAEVWISRARIVVCVVFGTRSAFIWGGDGWDGHLGRALLYFPSLVAVIVFSLGVLRRAARGPLPERTFVWSVAADAGLAFTGLATNPLWPWSGYPGLTNMPDLATLVLLALTAGLRLSPRAAIVGATLHGVSYLALLGIERAMAADLIPTLTHHYLLYLALVLTAGAAAVLHARWTRSLVEAGAMVAVSERHARRSLDLLMDEHHETRSLLSAVRVRAEMLGRELKRAAPSPAIATTTAAMEADLERLTEQIKAIRRHTYGELLALQALAAVPLGEALDAAVAQTRAAHPEVTIGYAPHAGSLQVRVAGGRRALARVLRNILFNACEGDGTRAASRIFLSAGKDGGDAVVVVDDDGPGFDPVGAGLSTKREGIGWGLQLVHAVAQASAGSFMLGPGQGGRGARATVRLPLDSADR